MRRLREIPEERREWYYVAAKEFGFRPKLTASLEFWETQVLIEGHNLFYSEAAPANAPSEPKSNAEQLAAMGFTVTKE